MEQLLKILEDNARLPIEDIATMLNKSPAEVAAMIDLARAQGIIKGYKTLVDWEKAGVNRVEAVIELNVSPKKSRGFDEIAATIAAFDEVESVWNSYRFAEKQREKIYVLDNGKSLMLALSQDLSQNRPAEELLELSRRGRNTFE